MKPRHFFEPTTRQYSAILSKYGSWENFKEDRKRIRELKKKWREGQSHNEFVMVDISGWNLK